MSSNVPHKLFRNHTLAADMICTLSDVDMLEPRISEFSQMLDDDESRRAQILVREEDQALFIASHGLLRTLLADETGQAPEELIITRNEHGKPQLDTPGAPCFSLSTSQNCVAIVISDAQPVGIDVECMAMIDVPLMLPMVGHEADTFILGLQEAERLKAFFRLWTGKEAILKAIGMGFQENPREINLGEAFLNGSVEAAQVAVFGQRFNVVCEETSGTMISLAY